MELYYFPLSTYSQKVLLAIYEKDIAFIPRQVNLMNPDERARYRALYPIGKVPMLKPTPEHVIPESSIIIEYLDQHYPRPQLIPHDPEKARKTRFLDRVCDLYVNNPVGALLFASWKPEAERDQEEMANNRRLLDINYGYLEKVLEEGPWLMGQQFTMADCALIPPLLYAQKLHPFDHYPNLRAYYKEAKARESYQRVLDEAMPLLDQLEKR